MRFGVASKYFITLDVFLMSLLLFSITERKNKVKFRYTLLADNRR